MKCCSKCGNNKDPTEFSKYSRNKIDGLRADCKKCQSIQTVIDSHKRRVRNMNNGRFQSIYNGLPQNLKKVYDVVPMKDSWGESMIMSELSRLGFSYSGDKSMIGTLNRLKDLCLIKETEPGKFKKEEITEKVVKKEPKAFSLTVGSKEVMASKETKTPLFMLNDLAMQAVQLANLCKKLASDIESAAINIDDHIAFTQKDSLKLKQLQELLKG